jgi:hypothetical protein
MFSVCAAFSDLAIWFRWLLRGRNCVGRRTAFVLVGRCVDAGFKRALLGTGQIAFQIWVR